MQNNNNYGVAKTNNQVAAPTKTKFSTWMETVGKKVVANALTDPKRQSQFIANIVSAVANNPTLAECEQSTILSAALQAEAMHFPINNALGYAYLVPFDKKEYNPVTRKRESVGKVAQFQIGYKGYIQLAIRSGLYKDINVIEVKEGELGKFNPLYGQQYNWIEDYDKRKAAKTIGYVAMLELTTGFKKEIFWKYEAMLDHANTYSQAFDKDIYSRLQNGEVITDENGKDISWKFSSFWYKDFDEMAKKTMIRQLLSKWGIMSVEMQEAFIKDQAEMKADGTYDYIDAKVATEKVEQHQKETMASVKVTNETVEDAEVVEDAPANEGIFNYEV